MAEKNETELLECHYCGGECEVVINPGQPGGKNQQMECPECYARGPVARSEEEAIKDWKNI